MKNKNLTFAKRLSQIVLFCSIMVGITFGFFIPKENLDLFRAGISIIVILLVVVFFPKILRD